MHDHRPGDRRGWPDEQRREVLFDPREPASVRLLRSRMVVEDADRRHRVVRRIDHVIGHETFDITDDRNGTLLDPAYQLFGHASLCSALTNGGVHGLLLHRRAARSRDCRATMQHAQNRRDEQQDFPRTEPYVPRNDTIMARSGRAGHARGCWLDESAKMLHYPSGIPKP